MPTFDTGTRNIPVATLEQVLQRALAGSRYARRMLQAEPQLLPATAIDCGLDAAAMQAFLTAADIADEASLWRALRTLRKQVMLRIIARDLGGLADLNEVVTTVSALAETSLQWAVDFLEQAAIKQYGTPRAPDGAAQQLQIVGMGKLGGRELNVSSDIDLVFIYPEEGDTDGARSISNHEFFTRLARRLIAALNEITADGYVFRVDMRLRPWGGDGPLACSFDMLENYLLAHGREWERYAWIKGRVLRGDRDAELMQIVQPFVFRRHLDYSAFESLRALHHEVRQEVERRDIAGNIKLGPGGIREIEFIVQLFQLIRGGHDGQLRDAATLGMLPRLAERRLLPAATVAELTAAYIFLRNLEHRLQYLDDQQTQTLPTDATDLQCIAVTMGCASVAELEQQLAQHRALVTRHFVGIFADHADTEHALADLWFGNAEDGERAEKLQALGYDDPAQALRRIAALREGRALREMPETSRLRLQQLLPLLLEAASRQPNPDATFARLLDLIESISRREAYLALLLQYPQTIERGARLASASPWAAAYLSRHPILLDELLDDRALDGAPDWPQLQSQLHAQLAESANDIEQQMNILRHFKHSQTMRLIAQDLGGTLTLEQLSDYLSELADLILAETLHAAWQGLRQRHRDVPLFSIIAYGKLGGKELGYASDLDLIFLYEEDAPEASENYARLAQRLNHWLTSLTPAGVLYETDLRLRPDGASGLLVSSLQSFEQYQKQQAWVWEHQALTRARFVAGDLSIGKQFEKIREDILRQPRDLAVLKKEVIAMRRKISDAHRNSGKLFDLKQDRGGLIDVEFLVQYLVLGHAHQHPELALNSGNLALLGQAARLGLIDSAQGTAVQNAYRKLRRLQHALRLQGDKQARVEAAHIKVEVDAVKKLWDVVLGTKALVN